MSNAIIAEKFVKQALSVHGNAYDYSLVLSRNRLNESIPIYLSIDALVFITCPRHGEFLISPREHLKGKGCPLCHLDKNLDTIKHVLTRNNISFEPDFVIPVVSWKYKYDLYLPDYNTAIQFHGLDHTKAFVEYEGENFRLIKQDDILKDSLAREFGIKVIYITYKHLRDFSYEKLSNYILNILRMHRFGETDGTR